MSSQQSIRLSIRFLLFPKFPSFNTRKSSSQFEGSRPVFNGWCCSLPKECGLVKYCIIRNSDYHNWFLGEQWFPGWEMFQKRYPRLGQKQTSILTVTRWLHSHENCVGCLRFMSCLYTLQFLLNYISNYINTNLTVRLEIFLAKFLLFQEGVLYSTGVPLWWGLKESFW